MQPWPSLWRPSPLRGGRFSLAAQQVPAACVPPEFGDPPIVRPIDRATTGCDLDGEASASDPTEAAKQSAQNVMKNEFCAWRDTDPALVTRFSFDAATETPARRVPVGLADEHADCGGAEGNSRVLHNIGGRHHRRRVLRGVRGLSPGRTLRRSRERQLRRSQRQDIDIHLALVTDRPWTWLRPKSARTIDRLIGIFSDE